MADAYLIPMTTSSAATDASAVPGVVSDISGKFNGGELAKHTTDGTPSPSARIGRRTLRVLLGVKPGTRKVFCQVRLPSIQALPPRLMVYPNPEIGLNQFLTATAVTTTDWQELSVSFEATAFGAVRVEFTNPGWAPCLLDELRIR